ARLLILNILPALTALQVPGQGEARVDISQLITRAEQTGIRETSRYADVVSFLEQVSAADSRMHMASFGYSLEGRALLMVVVGTGLRDASPQAVRVSGKLRVWIQGNIHSGEAEGKEAM